MNPLPLKIARASRWLAGALLVLSGCTGELGLRYGQELCDGARPCPEGLTCQNGVCVESAGVDPSLPGGGDPTFDEEWESTTDPDVEVPTTGTCRVDAQCGALEACVDGQCLPTPCSDLSCAEAEACSFQCIPTPAACEGVRCADNLEVCVNGRCVPSCLPDQCADGCDPEDPNCSGGACINDTVCVNDRCVEYNPCDDRFCPDGFLCSLNGCRAANPCNPSPCNPGWVCQVQDGQATCVESLCSGKICGAGEQCRSGNCVDPCADVPCDQGGRLCPDGRACCDGVCCEAGLQCRGLECLPPAGVCEPECGPGQICVNSQCYCREDPSVPCDSGECCVPLGSETGPGSAQCVDPCAGNPCADNLDAPLCSRNCALPEGFECKSSCEEIDCSPPPNNLANTECNPADGACVCGPDLESCRANECCIAGESCEDPCFGNPCAENPEARGCRRDCTLAEGFECIDLCDGVTCAIPGTSCDRNDGLCKCGPQDQLCATESFCCVEGGVPGYGNDAGEQCVADPCDGNPCFPEQCVKACELGAGFFCQNNCTPAQIATCQTSNQSRNPECNPLDGSCFCTASGTPDICVGNERCVSDVTGAGAGNTLGCDDPCSPNPCGADACIRDGQLPQGFRCQNLCEEPVLVSCGGERNPTCDPSVGECACGDIASGFEVCDERNGWNQGECCNSGTCEQPCNVGGFPNNNPCTNDGSNPTGDPDNVRCSISCSPSGPDFACSDPCTPTSCGAGNPNSTTQNPECRRVTNNGGGAQCRCQDDGTGDWERCTGNTCCTPDGCQDPCDADPAMGGVQNPCASEPVNKRCQRNCTPFDDGRPDYQCVPACTAGSCPVAGSPDEPTCIPLSDGDFECKCGTEDCDGPNAFCDTAQDPPVCIDDPCAGDPCGAEAVNTRCEYQQAAPGFRCVDPCGGLSCQQPTPDLLRSGDGQSCQCACGTDPSCSGSTAFCTDANVCDPNPCLSPDPCTTGDDTLCQVRRNQPNGFICVDPCDALSCAASEPDFDRAPDGESCQCACGTNTNCDGANAVCNAGICDVDPCDPNPCSGTQSRCEYANNAQGYVCVDPCAAISCAQPEPDKLPSADGQSCQCACGTNTNCSGSTAFCTDANVCDPNPCLSPDPCTTEPDTLCQVRRNEPSGFVCLDPCAGLSCGGSEPDPYSADGESCQCACGTDTSCDGVNAVCNAGSCDLDPCNPNPCGPDACEYANNAQGYECINYCSGDFGPPATGTCPDQNPDCQRSEPTPAERCGCGPGFDTCAGAECCVSDSCQDVCGTSTPCAGEALDARRCVSDCSNAGGFACENWCPNGPDESFAGTECTALNTSCNPNNGECQCGAGGDYEACQSGDICCPDMGGFGCQAPACTDSECTSQGLVCDPCTGCFDPGGG